MQRFDATAFDGPGIDRHVSADESDGNVLVVTKHLDPGDGSDYHAHPDSVDLAVVLSGTMHVLTGAERAEDAESIPVSAGSVAYVPPGEPHALVNDGDEPCTFVFVQAPPDRGYTPDSRDER